MTRTAWVPASRSRAMTTISKMTGIRSVLHYGKHDAGRMPAVVQDRLPGNRQLRVGAHGVAGVGIAVPAREAAGRHLEPDPVPGSKQVAGRPEVDDVLCGLTRRQTAGSDDSIGEVDRPALRIDVAEP